MKKKILKKIERMIAAEERVKPFYLQERRWGLLGETEKAIDVLNSLCKYISKLK